MCTQVVVVNRNWNRNKHVALQLDLKCFFFGEVMSKVFVEFLICYEFQMIKAGFEE